MMDGNPTHFLPTKGMIIMAICILGVVAMLTSLLLNGAPERGTQRIEISTGYETQIIINGDTTKKIYVLQDSLSGIVWVGIPGKNGLKK